MYAFALQTLNVNNSAKLRFLRSRTTGMQNNIARLLEGLEANQIALLKPDHPRWWELPSEPPTPIPVNVKYACDATLGSPSIANCEAALYEFIQSGDVTLDPALGPIIKVSGRLSDSHPDLEASSDCR